MYGVVGCGYVGSAVVSLLEERLQEQIMTFDIKDIKTAEEYDERIERLATECDVIFLCVPTPQMENGQCDTSLVFEYARTLVSIAAENNHYITLVQKSTCIPGTANAVIDVLLSDGYCIREDFSYVVNPEFLVQSQAREDMLAPDIVVFGVVGGPSGSVRKEFVNYFELFPGRTYTVTLKDAEAIKYSNNCAKALLLSFWNELYTAGDLFCDNIQRVIHIVSQVKSLQTIDRVCGQAFGGACLPKDVAGLLHHLNSNYVEAPLLAAVKSVNDEMAEKFGVRTKSFPELQKELSALGRIDGHSGT